jgi:hypothetical protein
MRFTLFSAVPSWFIKRLGSRPSWSFVSMKLPPVHPDPNRPHLFHNLYFFGTALLLALLLFAWTRAAP